MTVKILMLIFIIFLFLTAWYYFFALNQEKFIIFDISQNYKIKRLIKTTAISLIIMGFIGVIILFTLSKYYNFITLFISAVIMTIFSFRFTNLNN
ncbi:TRAP-type C4-dicarboxylate transport system permease small subunit [Lactobacillus colini]|uniref:TRAP-type C4-dicarboxylate transport system permease small subunit n=1 Tax=Lactobacillus colini TaxID=1819254 RepID=A0ABS4MDR7_9LACO|nr:hypothetical protein [Lactobacillus colini]MBP2057830.1 TRAP-type C4-dicarboxylate transport system permease small subunit [Lactobacillus colini]